MDIFAPKPQPIPYQQQNRGGRSAKRMHRRGGGRLVLHKRKPRRDVQCARQMAMIRRMSPIGRQRVDFNSIR